MKFAVVIKRDLPVTNEVEQLLAVLQCNCDQLFLPAGWNLPGTESWGKTLPRVDLVVVLGGDGTLLEAVRLLEGSATPIFGVNLGRLGFMVEVNPEEMAAELALFKAGKANIQSRLMLQVEWPGSAAPVTVLNEVGLMPQDHPSMLYLQTKVDGEYLSSFSGDGLLVATPTGSTGHSLSAGGSILEPLMEAILLTPLCPRTLSVRPLAIHAKRSIEITICPPSTTCLVRLDGRVCGRLQGEEKMTVKKSPKQVNLVASPRRSFFQLLHKKLGWGD